MNLLFLILFGVINVSMVLSRLVGARGRFYEFPFWAGMIALGWFYPQAVGGYVEADTFPSNAYADGMLFASLCMLALWGGFGLTTGRPLKETSWLAARFDMRRLYWAGVTLCVLGFFFQWKLWSLPEELLAQSQWSGATVKYLFFASLFVFGFLILWLLYLMGDKPFDMRLLVLIIPCLAMLLQAAVLRGRRSEMMNLVSYVAVGLWLVRRIAVPRWLIITGLALGLLLINGIGAYRAIMKNKDLSLKERLTEAANADYLAMSENVTKKSGDEFKNYIYYRQAYADVGMYDYGGQHWNRFVFNYIPAQIFGSGFKESLMIKKVMYNSPAAWAKELYGHKWQTGSTSTGYCDAFGSFGWFGWIKFLLIGMIMGSLYRYAMAGGFLAQMLYLYTLALGMQSVTHGTNDILVRVWVYFLMLCYPMLYWAKMRVPSEIGEPDYHPGA